MKYTPVQTLVFLFFAVLLSLPCTAVPALSASGQALVAQAVAAECGDAPYGVQIALAAVILNRMEDPRFGDTAASVIWGEDFLVCTRTGRIAVPVSAAVYARVLSAVRCAEEGMDPTDGALWYGGGMTGRHRQTVSFGDGGYLFWKD